MTDMNSIERLNREPTEKHAREINNRFSDELATEMEKADWKNYQSHEGEFKDIENRLERLARVNPQRAIQLWDEYSPQGTRWPDYLNTTKDIDIKKSAAGKDIQQTGESEIPRDLRKRYLIAENKFYFRDQQNKLAFSDDGKRLTTTQSDGDTATAMIALAEAKGWTTIKVNGTEEFRREAWLQASVRDIKVTGYKPKPEDHAKLEELRREKNRMRNQITLETSLNEKQVTTGVNASARNKGGILLAEGYQVIADVFKQVMTDKGLKPEIIDLATGEAIKRLETMQSSGIPSPRAQVFDKSAPRTTMREVHFKVRDRKREPTHSPS